MKLGLQKENSNLSLVELVHQLQKDVNLVGFGEIEFDSNDEAEFIQEFLDFVNHSLSKSPLKFRAFLYRVDVSESELVNLLSNQSEDVIEEIAELVLVRIMERIGRRKSRI